MSFAAVGSPLLMGTVLAGGAGSYLLPDLPGAVSLRVSDPEGAFETQTSGALTPPDAFDTDLNPAAVPGLTPPVALAAVAFLAAAAHRRRSRTARPAA